jgi:O-antigen ligase
MLFIALTRNIRLIVPLVLVIVLVFLFAPPYVQQRLASITDLHHPENATRIMLWSTGLKIFTHYPVVGVGDIDLREMYDRYADEVNPEHHGHLHNVPLQILVTLGLVGFIALTALFATIAVTEWRVYTRVRDEWFRGSVALGALAVFVGFHVMGLTEWSFGDQEVVILLWVTVGMSLAVGRMDAIPISSRAVD